MRMLLSIPVRIWLWDAILLDEGKRHRMKVKKGNWTRGMMKGETRRLDQNQRHGGRDRREPELIEPEIRLRPAELDSPIDHASLEVVCA